MIIEAIYIYIFYIYIAIIVSYIYIAIIIHHIYYTIYIYLYVYTHTDTHILPHFLLRGPGSSDTPEASSTSIPRF